MTGFENLIGILQLGVVVFFISYVVWFAYLQFLFRVKKTPPGPIGLPFVGYSLFLKLNKLHEEVAKLNKIYGKVCSLPLLHKVFIFTSDYDVSEELLKHPCVQERPLDLFRSLPIQTAFPFVNGKEWSDGRRSCMHAVRNIGFGRDEWHSIVKSHAEKVAEIISESRGMPLDFFPIFTRAAVESTMLLILGKNRVKFLTEKDIDFATELRPMIKPFLKSSFIPVLFPTIMKFVVKLGALNFGGGRNRLKTLLDNLRIIIKKQLMEDDDDESTKNFVQSYMDNRKMENYNDENFDVSMRYIIQNIIIFLITNESPLAAMRWLLLVLAANPEMQQKMRSEFDEVLGKNGDIPFNHLEKLPYAMACFKETLRWATLVPLFPPRVVTQSFEFHGRIIPKNSIVICNSWAFGRDPKFFENAQEFNPERIFDSSNGKPVEADGMAFSVGRRKCPAKQVSYAMMAVYCTAILRRFKVQPPPGEKPDFTRLFWNITDPVKQPLCFVERENKAQ